MTKLYSLQLAARKLEKTKDEAVRELETSLSAIAGMNINIEEDKELLGLISYNQLLCENAAGELNTIASYSLIRRKMPVIKSNGKLMSLNMLNDELRKHTRSVISTTQQRKEDELARYALQSREDSLSALPWEQRNDVPERIWWTLEFRCLRLPGYEDTWEFLKFNPKDFLEWWRDDRERGNEETNVWGDFRNLAGKLFYSRTVLKSPEIVSIGLCACIGKHSDIAKTIVVELASLISKTTHARDEVRVIFEIATPAVYIICDIIKAAYILATGPLHDERGFISKIEYQSSLIGSILERIKDFTFSLRGKVDRALAVEGQSKFSVKDVVFLCKPILGGEELVEHKEETENHNTESPHEEQDPSDLPIEDHDSGPPTPRARGKVDVAFLKRLGLACIKISEGSRRWIGTGSYGEVFAMECKGNASCWCAVKIPVTRTGAQNRIEREAEIWCKLENRNILPLMGYAIIEGHNLPCLVSPCCVDGLDVFLRRWRNSPDSFSDKSTRLSERRRFQFLEDIMNGLTYLHGLGFIHGDLRAANILVRQEDSSECLYAVLADFGVSDSIEDVQSRNQNRTTENQRTNDAWLSPELMRMQPRAGNLARVSQKGDIWAFGCVMLEVQYNTSPFERNFSAQTELLVHKALPAAKEEIEGLREPHWALMLRCWDFDVDKRIDITRLNVNVSHLLAQL